MKLLALAIAISALVSQWATSAHAQARKLWPWEQWELDKQMDVYVRAQIKDARGDCARKLGITILPNNTIDLVARYGQDKANAFNDCVVDEMGLDWRK